ncbi:MAG: PhoH family protein [Myxococcales bacterium]|nr:PhoH family protein [Myxococcales bacterium]
MLNVRLHIRGKRITIEAAGDAAEARQTLAFCKRLLVQLYEITERGFPLAPIDVERAVRSLKGNPQSELSDIFTDVVLQTDRGRSITPKGLAQKQYVDSIRRCDVVFGVGPAGTGKTYLAMAMALDGFLKKRFKRIVLTRPAVEAGERLGFLPGDLAEKVNPYLRPLKDALHDMVDFEKAERLIQLGEIEVAPLAFMRGRTLNDCFVILDEAQNATREQMKMFLTRLGYGTKAVVTGDVTQVDLPSTQRSGLAHATELLSGIEGIAINRFTDIDVVRHPLVMKIIRAYERADAESE